MVTATEGDLAAGDRSVGLGPKWVTPLLYPVGPGVLNHPIGDVYPYPRAYAETVP
jgi:hypothetical protein